jgi:tetratricopeptide (TPR) repeat protein
MLSRSNSSLSAVVDLHLGPSSEILVQWAEAPGRVRRTVAASQVARVLAAMKDVQAAERTRLAPRMQAAWLAASRELVALLDGPERALHRRVEGAVQEGRALVVAVRALADQHNVLREHPATRMLWQLLPFADAMAHGTRRFHAVLQLGPRIPGTPQALPHRGLRILFMAFAPQDVQPVLDHETEEERYLELLAPFISKGLALVRVVEDGTLEELARVLLVDPYDVLILTGHGVMTASGPRLVMEDDTGMRRRRDGKAVDVSPAELISVLRRAAAMPALVALSNCHSAESLDGMPSFAVELVAAGVPAVLGWTRPVRDDLATRATSDIFRQFAAGKPLDEAVELAREALRHEDRQSPRPDGIWATLALVASDAGGLRVDRQAPPLPVVVDTGASYRFLASGQVKVLERGFVGRRRPLQRLVRALRDGKFADHDSSAPCDVAGVVVWGMKGVGKSCLVGRAVERVTQHEPGLSLVVLHGALDESAVFHAFQQLAVDHWDDTEAARLLSEKETPFLQRVRRVLARWRTRPVVLILDDFEQNLEVNGTGPARLQSHAAALLDVLLPACKLGRPKLLITTTAMFAVPMAHATALGEMALGALETASVRKLWMRGPSDCAHIPISLGHWEALAARLGHNARILGWARDLLAGKTSDELAEIAARAAVEVPVWQPGDEVAQAKHDELAQMFLRHLADQEVRSAIGADAQEFLRRARVYEAAVPVEALARLAEGLAIDLERDLVPLANLGLLEVGEFNGQRAYRVSPLIEPRFVASEPELWHAVASAYWWNTAQIAAGGYHVVHVHRAWWHAREGRHQELAEQAGGILISALSHHGRYAENKLHADAHFSTFPDTPFALYWAGEAEARAVGPSPRAAALLSAAIELLSVPPGTRRQPRVASCLHSLGKVLRDRGRFREARGAFEEALSIQEATGRDNPANVVATMQVYAELLEDLGELQKAERVFERALALCEPLGQYAEMAGLLQAMGGLYHNQGRLDEALAIYERVLGIQRQIYEDDLHPSVAATCHMMGLVLNSLERYQEATRWLDEALRIKSQVDVPELHPGQAVTLQVYGSVLAAQGDRNGARQALDRALQVTRRTLEDEAHPNVAAILHSLCGRLLDMRRPGEALDAAERCLAIERQVYPEQHPRIAGTLVMLGSAKMQLGDLSGARVALERAREMYVEIHGTEDHPGVAGALHNLAFVHLEEKNLREAIRVLRHALAIHERCHGGGDTARTAATEVVLAAVLLQTGELAEGQRRARHALRILSAVNPRHPAIGHFAARWPELRLPGTSRRRRRSHRTSVEMP